MSNSSENELGPEDFSLSTMMVIGANHLDPHGEGLFKKLREKGLPEDRFYSNKNRKG